MIRSPAPVLAAGLVLKHKPLAAYDPIPEQYLIGGG
jgi:hypothetical protein